MHHSPQSSLPDDSHPDFTLGNARIDSSPILNFNLNPQHNLAMPEMCSSVLPTTSASSQPSQQNVEQPEVSFKSTLTMDETGLGQRPAHDGM